MYVMRCASPFPPGDIDDFIYGDEEWLPSDR